MDTVRSRQNRWLGHILRHDSLLRITLEGQILGKKAYGRPRTMFLDWLLKTEESNISYEELKMFTQDRSRWSQWIWKPAIWQSTAERVWPLIWYLGPCCLNSGALCNILACSRQCDHLMLLTEFDCSMLLTVIATVCLLHRVRHFLSYFYDLLLLCLS